mgnify:CR=1 FL=1
MKSKKPLMLGTVLLCCGAFFTWYKVSGDVAGEDTTVVSAPAPRPVPTTLARPADFVPERLFPGIVEAKDNVEIGFSVDGLLLEINGQEGKYVQQGEIIARLDDRDFRNGRDAAKASFDRAEADFKRAQALFERKVISQAEYDAAKATRDVSLADYNIRAKALEDTVLHAPFDGVIATRYAEQQQHIKKQAAVVALQDISEIEVVIQVPERLMAHGGLSSFQNIEANFDVDHQRWFAGSIKEYSIQSDPVTRTYKVSIGLAAPEDLDVLPGMTATIRAQLAQESIAASSAISSQVPVEAIFSSPEGKSYVWVIPEQAGAPRKTEVSLGTISGDVVEITGGIKAGTRVATAGVHSLSESIVVRPMKANAEGLDG